MLTFDEIKAHPPRFWRGRLASLSRFGNNDPRVGEAMTALVWWRYERLTGQAVDDGHMTRQLGDAFLDGLAEMLCDPEMSGRAGGFIAPRDQQMSGKTGDPTVSRPAQAGVNSCTIRAPAPAEEAVAP